jgi:hypothetical protein
MRDRYERTPGPPITEEQKAHINMAFCTCISGSQTTGGAERVGRQGPSTCSALCASRCHRLAFHPRNQDNLRRRDHKLLAAILLRTIIHWGATPVLQEYGGQAMYRSGAGMLRKGVGYATPYGAV